MVCTVWRYLRRVETAPFGGARGFLVRIYGGTGKLYKFRA